MFDPAESTDPGAGRRPGADHALRLLSEGVAALRALEPGELADSALSSLFVELDPLVNQLDAVQVRLVGVWDARTVWAADGARSGASWLAAATERSRPAAAAQVRTARALRSMPVTEAAFDGGCLGSAKVRLLADAAQHAPELFAEHESMLVDEARKLRVDQLAQALAFWKARADPDGEAERAARQHDARSVHLSQTFRGLWQLDGRLEAEAGEALRQALDRRARQLYRAEKAQADAEGGRVTTTAAQRRADALLELALQAVAAGDDGNSLNVPAITAVVDVPLLADPCTDASTVVGQTEHGEPLSAEAARRLSCDCHLSRVVYDGSSTPVDLGTTSRLPSPAQRRALVVRDRGCTFPGCDAGPGWTSAHHLVHWVDGGPTDVENLVLLCNFHHHRVHEGGFGLRRLADGHLEFRRPDGRVLTVARGRAPDVERPWPSSA